MNVSLLMILNQMKTKVASYFINDEKEVFRSIRLKRKEASLVLENIDGNTILSNYDKSSYIKFNSANKDEIFDLVQSVMDKYDIWEEQCTAYIQVDNYQKIVEISHEIFHSPIIFYDSDSKVLAISDEYGAGDLNPEWRHLKEYGYTSLEIYTMLYNQREKEFSKAVAKPYYYTSKDKNVGMNYYSFVIKNNDDIFGRLMIMEKERTLNYGDAQCLMILGDLIRKHVEKDTASVPITKQKISNTLSLLLEGEEPDEKDLSSYVLYRKWDINDNYAVIIFLFDEKFELSACGLATEYLKTILHSCDFSRKDRKLFIVVNTSKVRKESVLHAVKESYIYDKSTFVGFSSEYHGLKNIYFLAMQAEFMIKNITGNQNKKPIDFYFDALNYLLQTDNEKEKYLACEPNVLRIWERNRCKYCETIHTLEIYLENERSIKSASALLSVHKNTLVYRIEQLRDKEHCDFSSAYSRIYMLVSIKILKNTPSCSDLSDKL